MAAAFFLRDSRVNHEVLFSIASLYLLVGALLSFSSD